MSFETDLVELKKNMTPRKALQFVAGTIVSLGATAAVAAMLKSPVQSAKGITKWMMRLGIFVLGCKAGDVAEKYFNQTVDEMIEQVKEAQEEMKDHGSESDEQ